jgi:hypothetical protein
MPFSTRRFRASLRAAACVAISLSSGASAASWMTELRGYDQRAANIGYRLAVAARPHCTMISPALGLSFDAIEQYESADRPLARSELGLGLTLQVSAVVPEGPADLAGVRIGDGLVAIAGTPINSPAKGSSAYARVENATQALQLVALSEPVELELVRGELEQKVRVVPQAACSTRFIVSTRESLDTFTDGYNVDLPAGLFRFAVDDDEVAAVAAHELAHGIFNQVRNRPKDLSGRRRVEYHADALGIALMASAGFSPRGAARFWTRFVAKDRLGFFRSRSHPSSTHRLAQIKVMVAAVDAGRSPTELATDIIRAELSAASRTTAQQKPNNPK